MDKYATKGLEPAPSISMTTIPMAGLLVDVYGLDEAAPSSSTPLTCLWLLHPRTRTRARMADIARRTVHAWHQHATASRARGLIALAFDMPNHGSRLVSEAANQAWDKGNDKHAIDMAAIIQGGATDVSALMGLVAGYLGREVDAHVCLGWSLGGHAAWWTWFGHDRVDAAVAVVACPDYAGQSFGVLFSPFLTSRSSLSPFPIPSVLISCMAIFHLSKRLSDLLRTLRAHDPKSILFGDAPLPPPAALAEGAEQTRVRGILDSRIRGKRLLVCSGADDRLVPDAGVVLEDRVYEGVGHSFSKDMVQDAVAFLVNAVAEGPRRSRAKI
ncbi:hypothetical protein AAL_00770 [Moelleriella libera RCEF 2490]|uniref:AB hydrolase-1 domain-containing protein n=1 Tax=Moelleriella libera RCEF 2490 TaxID=1081109 RepID=A0A166RQG7_9HYPO|nr:hypothetical protein AAL_00770 [Moelleriella libera RCEF 2490]